MNFRFDFYMPSEISEILGERLKTQRLLLNLTKEILAERPEIGIRTVARIESVKAVG